jgi:hypothetical protein
LLGQAAMMTMAIIRDQLTFLSRTAVATGEQTAPVLILVFVMKIKNFSPVMGLQLIDLGKMWQLMETQ